MITEHDIIIIGGGIAGCSTAYYAKRAGLKPLLIERSASLATGASGNPMGLVMPHMMVGETPIAAFNRAAYLHTISLYAACPVENRRGIISLAYDDHQHRRFTQMHHDARLPHGHMGFHGADDLSAIAGMVMPYAGLYFPQALTINPVALCHFLLADTPVLYQHHALQLNHSGGVWHIMGPDGVMATAPRIVVANANDAACFVQTKKNIPLRPRRGQVTYLPTQTGLDALQCSIVFSNYLTPAVRGFHILGASYEHPKQGIAVTELTTDEHQQNINKAASLWPNYFHAINLNSMAGRAHVRATTPDQMPIVGPVDGMQGLSLFIGLGSRGLTTAPYCAQLLIDNIINQNNSIPRCIAASRYAIV